MNVDYDNADGHCVYKTSIRNVELNSLAFERTLLDVITTYELLQIESQALGSDVLCTSGID